MAIEKDEMEYEIGKLEEIEGWLEQETSVIKKNEKTLSDKIGKLRKDAKGHYSEELETCEKLYQITHKSLENYIESKAQPYFARIDFREKRRDNETFYIGKFGLGDSITGEEKIIDWRAPIADLYYGGTQGAAFYEAPIGYIEGELNLKRKFVVKDSKIIEAYDEGINDIILNTGKDCDGGSELIDEFLKYNLEESSGGKLKDVVATIQKEQNAIIRGEKNKITLIQGSAGSGKTTIALHRLAYLLYKYRKRIKDEEVLVVAPNRLFLDYISDILPNLGVNSVKQSTYEGLFTEISNIKLKILSKDNKLSNIIEGKEENIKNIERISKFKGSIHFKNIIDKYLNRVEEEDLNIDDIRIENYILFNKNEITKLYSIDFVNLPLKKRKEEIERYFKLKLEDKIAKLLYKIDFTYEYEISQVKALEGDSIQRRKKLISIYEERDSRKKELEALSKKAFKDYFLKWVNRNILDIYLDLFSEDEEYSEETIKEFLLYMKGELEVNIAGKNIDSDDLAPLLYLKYKIEGVESKWKFQHIVVDEAQDYSEFQILTLKYLSKNNSMTLVGDIGQCIYYYRGIDNWDKLIKDVLGSETSVIPLTQSYRSTVEIISLASKVLNKQNNNLKPALPVLRHGHYPEIVKFLNLQEFSKKVDTIIEDLKYENKKSTAIICKTYSECKKVKEALDKWSRFPFEIIKGNDKSINTERIILPSYMTKGLEFDCTIISNCDNKNYKEKEIDKRILYVALTRALHREYIFYMDTISSLIQ